jgi:SAM-dependent methyltransferase
MPGMRVLDIGCGSGEITQKVSKKGYSVVGLDFSSAGIEIARAEGLELLLVDLDAGIPFDNNSFDVVWAGDVIEHIFDPIYVFKEICRVLVSGGLLLCTIPYDLYLTTRLRILFGQSYQESTYKEHGQYKHHTFFSWPLLKYMLAQADLQIREKTFILELPRVKRQFITNCNALKCFAKTIAIASVSTK